jgi:RND family efflux transporter MFP subunit
MKKWILIAIALFAAGALFAGNVHSAAAPAKKAVAVQRGEIGTGVVAYGNIVLPRQVDLSFAIAGTLKEISVTKGTAVSKGQVLARLDDTAFQDAVKRLELQYQQDLKTLELAHLDFSRAQEQVEEAAPRNSQQFTYYPDAVTTKTNIGLTQNIVEEVIASIKSGQYSNALDSLAQARALLDRASSAANTTQFIPIERSRSVSDSISTIRHLTYLRDRAQSTMGKAQLASEATRLLLEQAKRDLTRTALTAPYEGIISDISRLDEGSAVTTSTRIFHLVDTLRVEMNALMIELDVAGLRTGQEVIVTADALSGAELKGKLTFVSPVAAVTSGVVSYPVTITLEKQPGITPMDGMTASATIVTGKRTGVLLVPKAAVSNSGTRERTVEVLLDERSGRTEQRRIIVGSSDSVNIEVVSGLKEGDRVMVAA